MTFWLSVIGMAALTVVAEIVMWKVFRKKVEPLCFPTDAQTQLFKRLNIGSLRLFMLTHLLATAGCVFLFLLVLW